MSDQAMEIVRTAGVPARAFDGATTTEVSLCLDDDVTQERAGQIGALLGTLGRASSWWIGDYVRECVRLFGENDGIGLACSVTGYADRTLKAWMETAEIIPEEERSTALSFSTHIELRELYAPRPATGGARRVTDESRAAYRELRRELEFHYATRGQNRGHKDVRELVKAVLRRLGEESGVQLALAEFPTTEEELAETRAALDASERELQRLRLEACLDVQCPKCSGVWPTEASKAAAAAAHEVRLAGGSRAEITAAALAAGEAVLAG